MSGHHGLVGMRPHVTSRPSVRPGAKISDQHRLVCCLDAAGDFNDSPLAEISDQQRLVAPHDARSRRTGRALAEISDQQRLVGCPAADDYRTSHKRCSQAELSSASRLIFDQGDVKRHTGYSQASSIPEHLSHGTSVTATQTMFSN